MHAPVFLLAVRYLETYTTGAEDAEDVEAPKRGKRERCDASVASAINAQECVIVGDRNNDL